MKNLAKSMFKLIDKVKRDIKEATFFDIVGFIGSAITIMTCSFTVNILSSFTKPNPININEVLGKTVLMIVILFIWIIITIVMSICIKEVFGKNRLVKYTIFTVMFLLVTVFLLWILYCGVIK